MAGLETPPNSDDPIASLYKMSTTAGMGAGDYVEVNKTAVVSVLMAVLSLLSLLGWPFLLLGLVAVLCGAAALHQIRNSSGTQGGRAVAWLGILGALAVAGSVVTVELVRQATEAANARKISALLGQFSQAMAAGDHARAHALFVPEFQAKVPADKFQTTWTRATESDQLGRFVALRGNGRYGFSEGKGGAMHFGFTKAGMQFEKIQGEAGLITVFAAREEGQEWKLYDLPDIFPKTMPAPR